MKTRPILFSGPMVRALLDGRKTQTRRVFNPHGWDFIKVQALEFIDVLWGKAAEALTVKKPIDTAWAGFRFSMGTMPGYFKCPYGQPGDRLWVREAFRPIYPQDPHYNGGQPIEFDYREGYQLGHRMGDHYEAPKWKPSIHMPRRASRITIEITGVRVERLQDISDEDAIAEGMPLDDAKHDYMGLWDKINGPGSWAASPWVWVISFRRIKP